MTRMQMVNSRDILKDGLERDPAFRQFWVRTAPARAIANSLIAYRIAHGLSQSDLARRLGVKPSRVERLESGEHNPTWDTLDLLAQRIGLAFWYGSMPIRNKGSGDPPLSATLDASPLVEGASVEDVTTSRTRIVVGAKVVDGMTGS